MHGMGIVRSHNQDHAVWTGRYWLKDRNREGVPFSIWMRVIDGKLTGTSLEPNVWALIDNEELDATLSGHIADEEVVFLKTYTAFEHEPVYFEGELSDDGTKIVGNWYFGWPNEWTGPFEMTCSAADKAAPKSVASKNKPAQ